MTPQDTPQAPAPQWVWDSTSTQEDSLPRISRIVFRRDITVGDAAPETAVLRVSACYEYRLLVNGEIIGSGPCRASPEFWEYDTYDLAPLLKPGANTLEVEARHHTIGTYHYEPMPPGFIAWGGVGAQDLATPGEWKCLRRGGMDFSAPRLSFAQAPVDFVDLRGDAAGAWVAPVPAPRWGRAAAATPRPREIPPLTRLMRGPVSVKAGKAVTDGWLIGNRAVEYDDRQDAANPTPRRMPFACRIFSPVEQTLTAGCWWGEYTMNGADLKLRPDTAHPFWQLVELPFKAGWNDLDMSQGLAFGFAENCMLLPTDKGLRVEQAVPSLPEPKNCVFLRPAFDPDAVPFTPIRHVAWSSAKNAKAVAPGAEITIPAGEKTLITVDMGGITLAIPRIELDGPAGTVVDITHAEECDADGRPAIGKAVVVYGADRFTLAGGAATLETLAPRGFRFLDILVSGHGAPVRVRSIHAVERRYPFVNEAAFECSDPDFNKLWAWSLRSFELCSEDVFVDCPWRERTLYGGDMLAEGVLNAVVSHDLRLTRRCLDIFLQSTHENTGWPPGRAPVPRREGVGGEYAVLTAISIGWYLRASGDTAFARRAWPLLKRMVVTAEKMKRPDGVYNPGGCFIDHGKEVRRGPLCAFNAAMRAAYREWAVCAEYAGEEADATRLRAVGDALDRAMAAYLDPAARCFRDYPLADGGAPAEGTPANAWALLFTDAARAEIPGVVAELQNNMSKFSLATQHLSCSPYQSFFLLSALREADSGDATALAEDSIRKIYGAMLATPTGTVWEMADINASCTHAWSSGPAVWFATATLGVGLGLSDPEELKKIIVRPRSTNLAWARGKVRHPLGVVEVDWKRKPDGTLDVKVKAPEGVEVVVK